ncbi:hypothetical protein DNTS_027903 [Danionella cerebrum]|uniref:RING-type domain-containing protein n=1 Tax=Danionella cerebrum TaxID=2873325 RepID=A0A553R807_9TELE|nr:hypothetical protein DNTS_027903 [Danionella translucida]
MSSEVRQPVICCNNHVFCSNCIKVWLEKSSQCPTCRVAITPENPCKEIIGATTDSDSSESNSVKRRIRKTRGELILREYEDEIETLLKEKEELKSKTLSLEMQLKSALEPSTVLVPANEASTVDHNTLEEAASKLGVACDLYKKVKHDLEKLRETNKTLRFGRYTVAALEAKIHQYERDVCQLKKALERSDKYIEELEAQNQRDEPKPDESSCSNVASGGTQNTATERITLMRRSLSEMEETSVCTNLDRNPSEHSTMHGSLLTTSEACFLPGTTSPQKNVLRGDPSTPSSALRSLSLKSPGLCGDEKLGLKPLTYLRRLSFDDCPTSSALFQQSPGSFQGASLSQKATLNTNKEVLCDPWMDSGDELNRGTFKQSEDLMGNSEASMDAAYLDKISELDSMMAEGESSSSLVSNPSLAFSESNSAFDATQIPELDFCSKLPAVPTTAGEQQTTHCDTETVSEEEASMAEFRPENALMLESGAQPTKRKYPPESPVSSPSKFSKLK